MKPDAVVVGGGISGLAAALRLGRAGARVLLLERSPSLGGMVRTEIDDGFIIEHGPDSFVAGKGVVLDLVEELGISDEVISTSADSRGSFVWWDGRLHPLPGGLLLMVPTRIRPLLGSSLLSWKGKARALADVVLPRPQARDDESLESFVTRRLGREVLDRIAQPLVAGIHAAEPATMSLRASFPRFLEMEREHRSLILAARAIPPAGAGGNGPSHFASLRGGMGRLTSAMAARLREVDVRTDVTVTDVAEVDGDGYRVTSDDGRQVETRAVILAIPAPAAASLLRNIAPEAAGLVGQIEQVATAAVTLAYRTDVLPPLAGSGFVVPAVAGRQVTGVSYLSRKWEGRVPDASYSLLRVFVGGQDHLDEDLLLSTALDELKALVRIETRPIRWWTHMSPQGLHRYTLGHVQRVARAEVALSASSGLALAGAAFHGIGLNECIASGLRAADSVLSAIPRSTVSPGRHGGSD